MASNSRKPARSAIRRRPITHVTIYVAGSCLGNPGPGGFGAVLRHGENRKELVGAFRLTTNNRMEVIAAIMAIQALKFSCCVTLHTRSDYLLHGAWHMRDWKRQGWRLNPPKARKAANRDLWKRLINVCDKHDVTFERMPNRSGPTEIDRCTELAQRTARGAELQSDEGFERDNPSFQRTHLVQS